MRNLRCATLGGVLLGLIALAVTGSRASALINLEFRTTSQVVPLGGQFDVGLYAVADSEQTQLLAALQVIFAWNNTAFHLDGYSSVAPLALAGFLTDPYGLNDHNPPSDGDGIIYALDQPGNPIGATQAGTLILNLHFTALAPALLSPINPLSSSGHPYVGMTQVYDGTIPNTDVTGALAGVAITAGNPVVGACCTGYGTAKACNVVAPSNCAGPTTPALAYRGDGSTCGTTTCCGADYNNSGTTSIQDLFDYLAAWFAHDVTSDYNNLGGVTIQDLFDYLSHWFPGC